MPDALAVHQESVSFQIHTAPVLSPTSVVSLAEELQPLPMWGKMQRCYAPPPPDTLHALPQRKEEVPATPDGTSLLQSAQLALQPLLDLQQNVEGDCEELELEHIIDALLGDHVAVHS